MIAAAVPVCLMGYAQEARVEKSVWGFQVDILSGWGYNEFRLADAVALRSEVGFTSDFSYFYSGFFGSYVQYRFAPELTVEPRWYYNLAGRRAKAKRTIHNSGNYLSLRTSFSPEWLTVSDRYSYPVTRLSIVPMWGIRRHYGTHFCLEASAGVGYRQVFDNEGDREQWDKVVYNLHFRVGYTF
jgi:hypothetical protein